MIKSRKYSSGILILFYLVLWILLFEPILPANSIFPKPSTVFLAFGDLLFKYQLTWNFLSTVSAIYLPLILAFYLCKILFPIIIRKHIFSDMILSLEWFSRYIPGIVLAMILIYWLPQSDVTKYLFAFLISFTTLMFRAKYLAENIAPEYSLGLKTFGISSELIARNVVWKAVQPELIAFTVKQNIYLWASILLFEFINLGVGLGTIFRKILLFKDLSGLLMMFVIIGFSIFLTTQLLSFIKNKFYFWKV